MKTEIMFGLLWKYFCLPRGLICPACKHDAWEHEHVYEDRGFCWIRGESKIVKDEDGFLSQLQDICGCRKSPKAIKYHHKLLALQTVEKECEAGIEGCPV